MIAKSDEPVAEELDALITFKVNTALPALEVAMTVAVPNKVFEVKSMVALPFAFVVEVAVELPPVRVPIPAVPTSKLIFNPLIGDPALFNAKTSRLVPVVPF